MILGEYLVERGQLQGKIVHLYAVPPILICPIARKSLKRDSYFRRAGLEPDRRTSYAGLSTSPVPHPTTASTSTTSSEAKATLGPADAADIIVKRRGTCINIFSPL